MKFKQWLLVVSVSVYMAGCAWVDLTTEGEKVRILSADEVTKCEYRGKTTVHTKGAVAGVERHSNKVQAELNILARNTAVEIGGDTVVPASPAENGKQVFDVYRCVPR